LRVYLARRAFGCRFASIYPVSVAFIESCHAFAPSFFFITVLVRIASARARELTHKAILGFKWLRTFREKRRNAWQETAKTLQEDIDKLDREIESLKEHGRQSALWKEATADKKIAQAELAKLRERMGKAGRRVRQSRTARKLSDLFRKSVEPPKKGGKP